jgi:hypothetical protein
MIDLIFVSLCIIFIGGLLYYGINNRPPSGPLCV